jgi:hypothetical protein
MRMITTLALGAALSLAALPALAQTSKGTGPDAQPNATPSNPTGSPTGPGSSTGMSNSQAPAASTTPGAGTGTRALTPGQNPDGTPREQAPGGQPQLPGMKGQGK